MGSSKGDIHDGKGALHAKGRAVKEFQKLRPSGDVIGLLADLEAGAVAFDLNGELQGACAIPTNTPLWLLTHLDRPEDKVELRKPCLADAPPANLESLKGALLDIASGSIMRSSGSDSSDSSIGREYAVDLSGDLSDSSGSSGLGFR